MEGLDSAEAMISTVAGLVARARTAQMPVVWVQHDDPDDLPAESWGWQIVPTLHPRGGDVMVAKQYRSAFAGTGLAERLRGLEVDEVVVTGAQSAFCVDMTGKHALAEGFGVTLVSDGHSKGGLFTSEGERDCCTGR